MYVACVLAQKIKYMNIKMRCKDGRGEVKDVEEDDEKGGIFTYAERGWVVPSSDSSRHTGDM